MSAKSKLKTKRAAAKRFRMTSSGGFKCDRANHEHIATKKPRHRKNRLKKRNLVGSSDHGLVARCLPYG